jgi:glycosyltransferase involved in cell wall biosynthesis
MADQSVPPAPPSDSLLLVTRVWGRDGGIAAHVAASAAALAASGMRVDVLVGELDPFPAPAGVTVHHAPRLLDADVPPLERLGPAASLTPGAVHLHEVEDRALVAALRRRAPVLISVHGFSACTSAVHYFAPGQQCTRAHGPGCIPNLLLRGCAHRLDPRPLPRSYRNATRALAALHECDLAVSYSSAVDRHLADNDVAPRAIVPLFATVEPARGAGHEHRRRVVFAGRVVPPKGLATLLRAIARVDAELVVCGDGWQLADMRRLAARLGIEQRVHFRGWLAAGELAGELANASLVAIPSLWPEPFGLVGIEALAAGRPVVASDTGGIGDWLREELGGLLCKPGDVGELAGRIGELLADPERQRRLGDAGRAEVAARFSLERHVAVVREAYATARRRWLGNQGGAVALPV